MHNKFLFPLSLKNMLFIIKNVYKTRTHRRLKNLVSSYTVLIYFNSGVQLKSGAYFNTLRTGPFKLFKSPLPGFLTILTL